MATTSRGKAWRPRSNRCRQMRGRCERHRRHRYWFTKNGASRDGRTNAQIPGACSRITRILSTAELVGARTAPSSAIRSHGVRRRGENEMAWAGKASGKQKTMLSIKGRRHARPLPRPDDPELPRSVMKAFAAGDLPLDKAAYQRRLQQLLHAYKSNGG